MNSKIALITGGGRGIGAETARLFVNKGARVIIASRTESELKSVCESINSPMISYIVADISDEVSVNNLFNTIESTIGLVDCVVNNAGVIKTSDFMTQDINDWDLMYAVNVRGVALVCQQAFRQMKDKGGSIVNVSSLAGITGVEKFMGLSGYVSSKFAVTGLTEALAVEGKPYGIRVNAIAPGAVQTQMLKEAFPDFVTPTTPADIAPTILFLSDEQQSGKLNGSLVPIHCN